MDTGPLTVARVMSRTLHQEPPELMTGMFRLVPVLPSHVPAGRGKS